MAKKFYIGVNNKARSVKKAYIGVNGKARRIKKVYIGVGGKARPCFSTEPSYYGTTVSPLAEATHYIEGASSSTHAICGGGLYNGTNTSGSVNVTAYDTSLSRTIPATLASGKYSHNAAGIGNYVLFAKGQNSSKYFANVEAYNSSLTKSNAANTADFGAWGSATSTSSYAFFFRGIASNSYDDAYDSSLTHKTFRTGYTYTSIQNTAATSLNGYAIYSGGVREGKTACQNLVATVNSSLTVTARTSLSTARTRHGAASTGNYALFAGGYGPSTRDGTIDTVEAYDTSFTRTAATSLSAARAALRGVSLEGYALFGSGTLRSTAVDLYDKSLTRTTLNLAHAHFWGAAMALGNYALFAGGEDTDSNNTAIVDVITV